MRNWKKIVGNILWSIAGVLLVLLFIISWKAKEEKKCASINVELVGENTIALFMDEKEILQIIHEKGIRAGLPIGVVNLNALEKNLQSIKWVKHAEMFLDNQQALQIKIEQRIPIARIFTASGSSFYIDKEGWRLPLKQLTVLRLPVFTGFPSDQEKLSTPDSLLLKDILHFTNAIQQDSFFMAQVAQINIASNGDFEMIPSLGDHVVLMGTAENIEDKLNRLFSFYKQVWVQSGVNAYQVLDCRFDHQIVALKKGMQPIQFSASILADDSLDSFTLSSIDTTKKVDTASKKSASVTAPNSLKKSATQQGKTSLQPTLKTIPKAAPKTASSATLKTDVKSKPKTKGKTKGKTKAKTTVKTNNKTNNKSLNNKKKSAKAIMPKKTNPKTTNN
jgi:cell division protein FtsQ